MGTHIGDDAMTLDGSPHSARLVDGGWELSWLPGQLVSRDQALSGLAVAESAVDLQPGDARWPLIDTLAAELGLTGPDAVVRVSAPLHDGDDAQPSSADLDDSYDADGWEQGEATAGAIIPAAVAIALPIAMAQISLLAAVLSLLVSVVLVILAGLIHRESQQRHAQDRHAARVLAQLTRTGGEHGDR